MRIQTNTCDSGRFQPRFPYGVTSAGGAGNPRIPLRTGAASFDFLAMKKDQAGPSQNNNPTLVLNLDDQGKNNLLSSSVSSSSKEQSGESTGKTLRRQIRVPSHKRKAKDGALTELVKAGKKPQLELRDEEILSSAETAGSPAGPNELRLLELPGARVSLGSSWVRSYTPKISTRCDFPIGD